MRKQRSSINLTCLLVWVYVLAYTLLFWGGVVYFWVQR